MKHNYIKNMLTALLLLCSTVASAYDFEVDGIYYYITDYDDKVAYVGYAENGNKYVGIVTIPSSVTYNGDTYKVRGISYGVFQDCTGLIGITIPEGVTSLEGNTFNGCSNLVYVIIPNSVTSIGENAFFNCSSLASITIPNGVTSIGEGAFYCCSGLTSIEIPNSVTSIGNYAFSQCGLTSITIPNGVTSIGNGAFYGCSGLTSIEIPNSVTSIGNYAFSQCGLTSITIPNGVTSIGNGAFYGCSSLTSVTIGNSVTSIGEWAFYGCSGLTSIEIPNSVTSIGNETFYGCSSLTSIEIPNSVTSIGESAFFNCSSLASVTIGNSVTSIGNEAFYGCSSLTSIEIPNSVTSIGDGAFYYCTGLTSITIPNGVTSIGYVAFYNCSSLTSITIPNSVTSIGESAFFNCSSLTSITIPNGVTSIGEWAFSQCGLTSVTIPNSVTSIGEWAFSQCGLTSVTIPNSVTSIGNGAFSGCSGLTSITIPNGVTSIGDWTFGSCTGLTSVTIPNSVTSIGYSAFYGCKGLASVTIGNSVTSIGERAFYACYAIDTVINYSPLDIVAGSTTHGYVAYYAHVVTDNSIIIGNFRFKELSGVNTLCSYNGSDTNIVLPENCNGENYVIGPNAFRDHTDITSVTIPNSVTSIGESAFYGCTGLTSITIGNSVTNIGENAFKDCTSLTNATIHTNTPPSIYYNTFENTNIANGTLEIIYNLDIYKNTDYWNDFGTIIRICDIYNDGTEYSYNNIKDFNNVDFFRTFTDTEWQAWYMPFDIPYSVVADKLEVAVLNDIHQFDDDKDGSIDRTELEIILMTEGTLKANYPYVVKAKSTGKKRFELSNISVQQFNANSIDCSSVNFKYTFTGTHNIINANEAYNNGYYSIENGALVAATLNGVAPNRWYLKIDSRNTTAKVPAKIDIKVWGEDESLSGDVNGDAVVNVSDFAALANIILEISPETDSADVNGDAVVNVSDFAALANIILNTSASNAAPKKAAATTRSSVESSLTIEPFSICPGEEVEVEVLMENPGVEISQIEFELTLPTGIEIVYDEENECDMVDVGSRTTYKNHAVATNKLGDNTTKIMCTSQKNKTFKNESGDVLIIVVRATDAFTAANAEFSITNTVLGLPDGETYLTPADYTGVISNTTGIDEIMSEQGTLAVYTLAGVKVMETTDANDVKSLPAGLYIINGKKVVVE